MSTRTYHELVITATAPDTEMWLGDDCGHHVMKATGVLRAELLPGEYTVEFGLGTPCYPMRLNGPLALTEGDLVAGGSCPRPELRLLDE